MQQATPQMSIGAWIYPGPPACTAMQEIADGRTINVLKPEYFRLNDDGTLAQITDDLCNGYSPVNAALIKKYSQQQFTTISGSIAGIQALSEDSALLSTFRNTLVSFLQTTGFTGVEIDVEDFASWSPGQYSMYKQIVNYLGHDLHAIGCQLILDGPAISNATEQAYYPWRYEDFNNIAVDSLVVMAYDAMYDLGVGKPVAPLSWIKAICQWMLTKVNDHNRVTIGINAYGYMGVNGSPDARTIKKITYQQATRLPGFATATRNKLSGEMTWIAGNMFYDYADSETINEKIAVVQQAGLQSISIWHIGGNSWFTAPTIQPMQAQPPMPTPPVTTPPTSTLPSAGDTLLADIREAFNTLYPGFDAWYQQNVAGSGGSK